MRITRRIEALLLAPLGLLLLIALLIPAGILFYYSFYRFAFYETYGAAGLGNYGDVFSDPLYRTLALKTLAIAIPTVLLSVSCGYALAYYLVFGQSRLRGLLFLLVLTALMASYLVRIYAWRTLLGETGVVNTLLESAGLIDKPLSFLLFTRTSAIIAEVNLFIPLAALTFFAALSGVSGDYKEASRDLGAGPVQTLRRVTLPLTGPAILVTTAVIFFLSCGDYITPLLVGGVRSQTVGMDVATSFGQSADYGRGAAVSFLIVSAFIVVFALLAAALRATRLLPRAR
jgi:spermidine/putrescine transport system permease protein